MNVEELVSALTLEEKAGLCSGADFWHTKAVERLGIPAIKVSDGPHGLRTQKEGSTDPNDAIEAVCFPAGCAAAASFDPALTRRMGAALGREARASGVQVLLGPAVNIKRSPLCGRNFEYYSEDPYLAGEGVGEAADALLWGDANPCGRLPETWPLRLEDTPCYLDYPGDGVTADYREGVYVGYRWYDARKMPVRWPFGHGLSYTGYVYRNAELSCDTMAADGEVTVRVTVKNSGAMPGAEVVQLYVADATGTPVPGGRVPQALRGFAKVDLQPGEERVVTFTLTPRDLSRYSAEIHDWYAAPGRYEVRIGHSSRDIRSTLPLHYAGAKLLPLTVDETTPLGILLADPRTAPIVRGMLDAQVQAMANGGGDGLMPPEAMIQMFDGLTLRNMINFGGPQAEERLNAMLAKLKEAVQ